MNLRLALGDNALILAQRLSEWAARSPTIEEDVALMNIALDLLGQARALLSSVGDEDQLAFLRDEREFTNCQLVELDGGDFGRTMARQLLFSAWQLLLWESLLDSDDEVVAGVAGKAVKEAAYHLDHARTWVVRLGDGTPESHARVQAGLDHVWPYAHELFEGFEQLREPWEASVLDVLDEATLTVPSTSWAPTGGRRGIHTEGFGLLLAEMQHLHRQHPGASW